MCFCISIVSQGDKYKRKVTVGEKGLFVFLMSPWYRINQASYKHHRKLLSKWTCPKLGRMWDKQPTGCNMMQSSRNKIQTKVWLGKTYRVLTGAWDHTPTLLWVKSISSSPRLRWKLLKWKQIHKRLLLSSLRDVSNAIILLWGGHGGKVTLSPLRTLTSLHWFDTFTLALSFSVSSLLCVCLLWQGRHHYAVG